MVLLSIGFIKYFKGLSKISNLVKEIFFLFENTFLFVQSSILINSELFLNDKKFKLLLLQSLLKEYFCCSLFFSLLFFKISKLFCGKFIFSILFDFIDLVGFFKVFSLDVMNEILSER